MHQKLSEIRLKWKAFILGHKHETRDKQQHLKSERNPTLTHYGMQTYQNQEAHFHLEQAPSAKFSKQQRIKKMEKRKEGPSNYRKKP